LEFANLRGLAGAILSKLGAFLSSCFLHARRLFQLLIGVAFLCLAFAGAHVALTEWLFYRREPSAGLVRFYLVAGFTVLLILFSLYSFAKARSVR
jgi:hypothetical protein